MPKRKRENTITDSGQLFFSEKVKERRKGRGLSQQEMADSLYVSLKTYQNWENGRSCPDGIEMLYALCDRLDCDIDFLFGKQECPHKVETDIHRITGLSENSIYSLKELNQLDDDIKQAVFPSLELLLDWQLLPAMACNLMLYISGEYDGKTLNVIDDEGKIMGLLPETSTYLLLQSSINQFLSFAKQQKSWSRGERRRWWGSLSEDEKAEIIAENEREKEGGK